MDYTIYMVYFEKQKRGRRIHYYLVKTFRLPNNKFKKIRHSIGSSLREYTKNEKEYLELKKERDEAIKNVDESLQALKEGRVYDL